MDFREILLQLKIHLGVNTNKELADKLGISEDGVKAWTKKKAIPKKYLKVLENKENKNFFSNNHNGNNNINVVETNNGTMVINSDDGIKSELCEAIKKLEPKRAEYYLYKIKAELLEKEFEK